MDEDGGSTDGDGDGDGFTCTTGLKQQSCSEQVVLEHRAWGEKTVIETIGAVQFYAIPFSLMSEHNGLGLI
jgi:hypothetical protein